MKNMKMWMLVAAVLVLLLNIVLSIPESILYEQFRTVNEKIRNFLNFFSILIFEQKTGGKGRMNIFGRAIFCFDKL